MTHSVYDQSYWEKRIRQNEASVHKAAKEFGIDQKRSEKHQEVMQVYHGNKTCLQTSIAVLVLVLYTSYTRVIFVPALSTQTYVHAYAAMGRAGSVTVRWKQFPRYHATLPLIPEAGHKKWGVGRTVLDYN